MPTNPANLAAVLAQLEAEHAALAASWRRQFLETRRARIRYLALVAAVTEAGRAAAASGSPEERSLARDYFAAGERMEEAARAADASLRIETSPDCQALDFNDPSPKEHFAAVATLRAAIDAALTEEPSPSASTPPPEGEPSGRPPLLEAARRIIGWP